MLYETKIEIYNFRYKYAIVISTQEGRPDLIIEDDPNIKYALMWAKQVKDCEIDDIKNIKAELYPNKDFILLYGGETEKQAALRLLMDMKLPIDTLL